MKVNSQGTAMFDGIPQSQKLQVMLPSLKKIPKRKSRSGDSIA
jgi:hypothetical protein